MKKKFCLASVLTLVLAGIFSAQAAMVTLTFDDGLAGVYNYALPVLKKHGVPGVSSIITSRIGSDNNDFMTWEQVRELAANGWEIASHSMSHSRPIHIPKFYNQEKISGWSREPGSLPIFQASYDYELINGLFEDGKPLEAVDDVNDLKNKPGSYFYDRVIEELHVHCLKDKTPDTLDIRAISYEREMEESKKILEKQGFEITTFVSPYNYWTDDVKDASKRYYLYAVTGKDADNRAAGFDPYAISRFMVHKKDSVSSLERIIKENAVDKNGWVIFCLHGIGDNTGWEPWGSDKLDALLDWLNKERIEVVTIKEGAKRMAAQAAKLK